MAGQAILTLTAEGLGEGTSCTPAVSSVRLNIIKLEAIVLATNITCHGANDGTITITEAKGGSGNYEFSINGTDWIGTVDFRNLGKGIYEVRMRDRIMPTCAVTLGSVTIIEPEPLFATTDYNDASCLGNDGIISVYDPVGGWGNYRFRLNDKPWQSSGDFTGLVPDSYEVWIGDCRFTRL